MAVEKDKVLAAIELKFKGKSITKTYKENLASKWAAKIESEEDIDTYISEREEDVLEAAAEADRRATEASKKAAAEKSKTEPNPPTPPAEDPFKDAPEWMKAYMKQQEDKTKALEDKLTGFEQANKQKTIAERFKSDPRVKDIPEKFLKGRIPQSEDDLEAAIAELENDWKEIATEHNITKFGEGKPGGAATAGKGGTGKVSDTVKQLAESLNKEKSN